MFSISHKMSRHDGDSHASNPRISERECHRLRTKVIFNQWCQSDFLSAMISNCRESNMGTLTQNWPIDKAYWTVPLSLWMNHELSHQSSGHLLRIFFSQIHCNIPSVLTVGYLTLKQKFKVRNSIEPVTLSLTLDRGGCAFFDCGHTLPTQCDDELFSQIS